MEEGGFGAEVDGAVGEENRFGGIKTGLRGIKDPSGKNVNGC